ncbi:murein L,D-transpeptidase family protein [Hyphomonas sp.]|uniref:L,D-transpeptidase family protein n=1 Tax=Hyphomonas sp. TaxID=87 RepID=UPI00391BC510
MRHKAGPRPNLLALLLAALAFLCLPALLAFAQAGTLPASPRSEKAFEMKTPELQRDLQARGLTLGNPVFLRITKAPAELTAYVRDVDGRFQAFRTWPVCSVSGTLGPKMREGDGQAPEGFYKVAPAQMNPASSYHLAFNLGYPNAFDRANGRTGSFLMVHGSCVSIGCFAMTDPVIEEIWTLMQAAFEGGQKAVDVHVYPFAMTEENLAAQWGSEHLPFWTSLAPAWTQFEETARVPKVKVSGKTYEVLVAQ